MSDLAPWTPDVIAELFRGRHVLLHGNVADQMRWDGGFQSVDTVLRDLLGALGYRLVAEMTWSDGFQFADRAEERAFHALRRHGARGDAGDRAAR